MRVLLGLHSSIPLEMGRVWGCKAQDLVRNPFVCKGYLGCAPSPSCNQYPCLASGLLATSGPCLLDKVALLMGDKANSLVQAVIAAALCPRLEAEIILPALVRSTCLGAVLGTSPALVCSLPTLPMLSMLGTALITTLSSDACCRPKGGLSSYHPGQDLEMALLMCNCQGA